MTRYTPLYMQEGTYPANLDRMLITDLTQGQTWLMQAGSFQVTQHAAGANMSVDVAPGHGVFPGNLVPTEGSYHFWSDAVENPPIAASPPSGQSRIDLVVAQIQNDYIDGSGNNDFLITTVQGTPATTGSQTAPALPPNCMQLAQVLVGPLVNTIVNANITDVRPPLLGQASFPPLTGTAPFQSQTDNTGEVWVAKGGVYGGQWRKARDVLRARVFRTAAYTIPAAAANIPWDTVEFDAYGMWGGSGASYSFVCPVAGDYQAFAAVSANVSVQNTMYLTVSKAGVTPATFL